MERLKNFTHSLAYASRGLVYVVKNEKNFQNELIAAALTVFMIFYLKVTKGEAVVLFLIIMAVLIMEILNTVMEKIMDILKPKIHPYSKLIKDLMAASVLMLSILALIVGVIIFSPYVILKLQSGGLI
jgi:diacylglycerol kinase